MLQLMNLLAKVANSPNSLASQEGALCLAEQDHDALTDCPHLMEAQADEAKSALPERTPLARLEVSFVVFIFLWTFIGLVSAYDGYLTIRYQHLLHLLEQNPVGRWIMDLDAGLELNEESDFAVSRNNLANFLGLKFAGTVLGLAIMLALHRYKAALGLLVTSIMAGLQGMLAVYLMCF